MYNEIIGIIGAPRSGTSWIGQIFDSSPDVLYRMQPFYSWAFRDKVHVRSSKETILEFFHDMYMSHDPYLSQEERRKKGVYPVFAEKKDNPPFMVFKEVMFLYMIPVLLEQVENLKIIAVIRNPIDVITSYYNAPREFTEGLDIQKEWYFAQERNQLLPERYFGYHKWKEYMNLVQIIEHKFKERVLVIKYEDLSKNPVAYTKEMFDFSHILFKQQTEIFLSDCSSRTNEDPYSVFRSKSHGLLKKKLPQNIVDAIKQDCDNFSLANHYGYCTLPKH